MTDGDVDELVDAPTARGTKEAKLREYILRCRFHELVELIRNNIERAQLTELAQEVGLATSERKQVIVERWLDHVGVRRPPVVEGAKSHIAQWRTEAQRFAAENQQKMAVTGRSREVAQRVGLRFERVLKELICFGCQLLGPGALERAIARAEEKEGRDAKTRFSGDTEAAVRWLFDQGLGTLRLVLGIVLKAARGEGKDCLKATIRREELAPVELLTEFQRVSPQRNVAMHDKGLEDDVQYQSDRTLILEGAEVMGRLEPFLPDVIVPISEGRDQWGRRYEAVDEFGHDRSLRECELQLVLYRAYYFIAHSNPDHVEFCVRERPVAFQQPLRLVAPAAGTR